MEEPEVKTGGDETIAGTDWKPCNVSDKYRDNYDRIFKVKIEEENNP